MMERSYLQNLLRSVWPKIRTATNGIVLILEKIIRAFINILKEQLR